MLERTHVPGCGIGGCSGCLGGLLRMEEWGVLVGPKNFIWMRGIFIAPQTLTVFDRCIICNFQRESKESICGRAGRHGTRQIPRLWDTCGRSDFLMHTHRFTDVSPPKRIYFLAPMEGIRVLWRNSGLFVHFSHPVSCSDSEEILLERKSRWTVKRSFDKT